jgi:glutathione S-transferase
MTTDITLYEHLPTRSSRCRWALLEAGLEFTSIEGASLMHSEELMKVHPLGKLPAIVIDGKPLFESAAICAAVADMVPEKKLIAESGTWARAQHEQWICFGISEMEAHLWSSFRNTVILPEDKRVPAIVEQNAEAFKSSAEVLDDALGGSEYLVGNQFSVTDIVLGHIVNWGRRQGLIESFSNLQRYVDRLLERPHCTLSR